MSIYNIYIISKTLYTDLKIFYSKRKEKKKGKQKRKKKKGIKKEKNTSPLNMQYIVRVEFAPTPPN